jgi:hypothetical protein
LDGCLDEYFGVQRITVVIPLQIDVACHGAHETSTVELIDGKHPPPGFRPAPD